MAYRVTAALVVAKDQAGRNHHCYRGAVIPWLGDWQREHFLRMGLVEELSKEEAKTAPPSVIPEKPAKVAPKEAWVEWGVSQGQDRSELDGLTKQELVDLLG